MVFEHAAAAEHAQAMGQWTWTPSGTGMPDASSGTYTQDTEYTGLPYSSTKHVGKTIGEEIFFKTFVAALANPESVLFSEDLSTYGDWDPGNAATYYGIVCSKLTAYGLGNGTSVLSRFYGPDDPGDPDNRHGVIVMHARAATDYDVDVTPPRIADIMWTSEGGHTCMITGVTEDSTGSVTHVERSESTRDTARTDTLTAAQLTSILNGTTTPYGLLRITNFDSWRQDNHEWIFPDYTRNVPAINDVVLLDRGDWVPYTNEATTGLNDQPVKFNVMDADAQELLIMQGGRIYERIALSETGVIERTINNVGEYTAKCRMDDGSYSQACQFAICSSTIELSPSTPDHTADFTVRFSASNAIPRFVFITCVDDISKRYFFFLNDADRANGHIIIPANTIDYAGDIWAIVVSENNLGRVAAMINDANVT